MEIALIPPASLMAYARPFKFQMMLPAPHQPAYLKYYHEAGQDEDRYLMLDNGAWESRALANADLIARGYRYRVQEIVVPDVLSDPDATLRKMQRFFQTWNDFCIAKGSWDPTFMAVAHGDTLDKAARFVDHVANKMPIIQTIAAGRAFSRSCDDPHARAKLAMWVSDEYPDRFEFHLLGYNDAWQGEIEACRGVVRSLDTSAPFSAAHYRRHMNQLEEFSSPRPKKFFDMEEGKFDLDLLKTNIKVLRKAAKS